MLVPKVLTSKVMTNKSYKTDKKFKFPPDNTDQFMFEINKVEKTVEKAKADKLNVTMHSLNGNKKYTQLKVLQMNKGNSDLVTKEDHVLANIVDCDADIIFLSEANSCPEDTVKNSSMLKCFKGYKCEESAKDNNGKFQALMLIRKPIPYNRIEIKDKGDNPVVAISVQTSKNEHMAVIGSKIMI